MKQDNSEIIIRKATEKDLSAVQRIIKQAFSVYLPRMGKKPFPMLDDYAAHITNDSLYVLEVAGEIRGAITLIVLKNGNLSLENLGVHPEWQKRGYGKKLIRFAESEAKKRKCPALELYTNEVMGENIVWYQRLGYKIIKRGEDQGYMRVYFIKNFLQY